MDDLTAADIMTREVISVAPDTTLREIAELLIRHRISGVPVVDANRHVIGTVSETDLIDEEKRRQKLPRLMLFGVWTVPEDAVERAFDQGDDLTAQDMMTRQPLTLPDHTPAREVAQEMVGRKVNRIPITHDDRLVGIVTRADVLRALEAHWRRSG